MSLRAGLGGVVGLQNPSTAHIVDGSLKFDEDNNTYLKITPGSNGNRRTWTWSGWVKRNTFGSSLMSRFFMGGTTSTSAGNAVIAFYQDRLFWQIGSSSERITTERLFRDNGWYHIVVALDTNLASDYGTYERVKIYVNGKREREFSTEGYPGEFLDSGVNSTQGMLLGAGRDSSGNEPDGPFDGQLSQVYLIDGLQLGPEYFGFTDPLTGTWKPKKFKASGTTVNDGRVFSSTGTFTNWDDDGTYPKTKLFDGQTYDDGDGTPKGAAPDDGNPASFDFGNQRITGFQNLKINIFISSNQASATSLASVNGIDITDEIHAAGNNAWTTVDLGNKFTTLQSFTIKNNNCYVGGFIIDGVIMKDSTTTNLSFGTNGFYLPLDGNSPIGKDQSGNGNDLTPINFGGSNSLEKATGAFPILNPTQGATQAGVGVRTDAYADNLVVAMPLVGITTDVSNLINGGTTPKTITQTGSAADIAFSTEQRNFYASSAKFAGNVARLEISGGGGTDGDYDFGTGDFTMECWFYATATANTNNRLFCSRGDRTNYQLMIGSNKYLQFDIGGTSYTSANNVFRLNKWHHFAATRQSGTLRLFVDGVIVKEQSSVTTDLDETTGIDIGYESGYSSYINGYMQDARVYKGVAKYTENFIPAATFPDILPDTPSGVSGSSKLAKVTEGAVRFDGSGDHLSTGSSSDYSFGTGDFTIEGYFYFDSTTTSPNDGLWQISGTSGGLQGANSTLSCNYETSGGKTRQLFMGSAGGWRQGGSDNEFLPLMWNHVAEVRSSGTISVYINGKLSQSWSDTTNYTFTDCAIGAYYSTSYSWHGYVSNFRVLKGTAKYTSNFTPPTAPLTNVTNTKLLCCKSDTHAPSATVIPSITTACTLNIPCVEDTFADQSASSVSITDNSISVGSAGSNTLGITTAAILPGGSGDAIDTRGTSFDRTGVYTIDCYFNYDGTQQGRLVTNYNPGNTGNQNGADGQGIAIATDGSINIYDYGDAVIAPAGSVVMNQWHHLRFIANNTEVTGVYLNGKRMPSTGTAIDNFAYNGPIQFGAGEGTVSHRFSGKLGPIRFTPGVNLGAPPVGGLVTTDSVIANNSVHTIFDAKDSIASNFNPFNTDINTVRGQETGYPTWNPLDQGPGVTLSKGNLSASVNGGTNNSGVRGTMVMPKSGKYFFAIDMNVIDDSADTFAGLMYMRQADTVRDLDAGGTRLIVRGTGTIYNDSTSTAVVSFDAGDQLGVAVDCDANSVQFYRNGVPHGSAQTPSVSITEDWAPWCGTSSGTSVFVINTGQRPFKFPPPDGFQPLNDANARLSKVISRPDQYVGVTTWKGNATTGRLIKGLKFDAKPDLIWIKNRGEDVDHTLYDSVRGFGANKELTPNDQYSEGQTGSGKPNSNAWGYVNSTSINGFTINNGSSGQSLVNNNNINYVAWCWKAGGNSGNFNIDHVGYSTAGDAAMSAGDQNSNGYNTDQNWGAGATGEINPGGGALNSGCFNGNFSDNINSYWGDTSKAITFTFSDLPFKKLRFYAVGQNISNSYVKFNGVAQTQAKIGLTNLKFGWFDAVDVPSPLNKIEVYTAGSSDFLSLYAVEVDGKILVNNNITPPQLPSIPATGSSVGTEQGFSIVTYTGTGSAGTIPHGLSQDPEFVIFKQRNNEDDWRVWHKSVDDDEPQDYYLMLQSQNPRSSDQNASFMNRVPPTGPVIHLGTDSAINGSSTTMVAYCWHSVPGFSKFGKYTANNDADGPYIDLGFKPAVVIVKDSSGGTFSWQIFDTKRDSYNLCHHTIRADYGLVEITAEPTNASIDILDTGFKVRAGSSSQANNSTDTYVYMAWAEAPSVDLYGGGANAR